MGKNIRALTTTAIKKVNQGFSPKDMPNGMPPLNSLMGKTVASRVKAISFVIICLQSDAGVAYRQERPPQFPRSRSQSKNDAHKEQDT
jgi:hypothetical protein